MRYMLLAIVFVLLAGCAEYNGPGAACSGEGFCSLGLACVEGTCQPDTGGVRNATQGAFEDAVRDSVGEKGAQQAIEGIASAVPKGSARFTVTVPAHTPPEDTVWVEFGWMGKSPLQRVSANVWSGEAEVPLGASTYAYSRNGIGFEASDVVAPGESQETVYQHRTIAGSEMADVVAEWRWWGVDPATFTAKATPKEFLPRIGGEFQDGIAVIDYWWDVFYENGETEGTIAEIKRDNAEWVQYSPTWAAEESGDSVSIAYDCGYCYPDEATRFETLAAKSAGLNVVWRTQIWQAEGLETSGRSEAWWRSLSEANREWILHSAELAQELGVEAIPVGAEYNVVTRAVLADEAPAFVMAEWLKAVRDARKIYSGKLYYDLNNNAPVDSRGSIAWQYSRVKDIVAETDFIGVSWWQDISDNCEPTLAELEQNFGAIADEELLPVHEASGKPIVLISLAFPSVDCGSRGNSLYEYDAREIDIWKPDDGTPNDMAEQALVYDAVLRGIAERPWITGVYSFGYWRHDSQDKQWNIRGKEAQLVLREWYAAL